MKLSDRPLRVGVEEEYQIVDGQSGQLRPDCKAVMEALPRENFSGKLAGNPSGTNIQHELHLTQIEMASPVCSDLDQVHACVADVRGRLIHAAATVGAKLVAAGTHPMPVPKADDVTPGERYRQVTMMFQQIARDLLIFGCHVHVDMPNRAMGVQVMNRVNRWLPVMQALSANSPFWSGEDTGYASYRRELWVQWPLAGPPLAFRDDQDLQACVKDLIASGAIVDATRIYWDVRLPEHIPTIEFRVMDVMTRLTETVAFVGLIRALVRRVMRDVIAGVNDPLPRQEVMRVAMWQAARFGVTDHLIDPVLCRQVRAKDQVQNLLDFVRDDLEFAGDYDRVRPTIVQMLELGGGATRQRKLKQNHDWGEVVMELARETGIGTV